MSIIQMKRRIVAVTTHKGGVGKTTISNLLASGLANRGFRVAWVDLDPQGQDALWYGMQRKPGLFQMLLKDQTAASQLEAVEPVRWAAEPDPVGALYILPGDRTNQQVWQDVDDPHLLRDKLVALLADDVVDWVILDTPPAISDDATHFLMAAGSVVIPAAPEFLVVQGVFDTLDTINSMERNTADWGDDRADINVIGIVPNNYDARLGVHRFNLDALRKEWGDALLPVINYYVAFKESPQNGQSIWCYMPGNETAETARARASRFMGEFMKRTRETVQHG